MTAMAAAGRRRRWGPPSRRPASRWRRPRPRLNKGDLARRAPGGGGRARHHDDRLAQPEVVSIVTLAGLGLQIEADRAQVARARRDLDRRAGCDRGSSNRRGGDARCLEPAPTPPRICRMRCAPTESSVSPRSVGRKDARTPTSGAGSAPPERPAGDWRGAAYSGYREAEALLATRGDRARAVRVLTAAHVTAGKLAAEPLRHEIESLARRARIELSDQPLPATGPLPPDPALAPLGLTARELDVLRLVAAGYTNPQIGEALYISRKTASHHVSSILTKLGVATRVEAAGVRRSPGPDPGHHHREIGHLDSAQWVSCPMAAAPPFLTLPPGSSPGGNNMERNTKSTVASGVVALALLAGCGDEVGRSRTAALSPHTPSTRGWPMPSGLSTRPTSTASGGRTWGGPAPPTRCPSRCRDLGTCRRAERSGKPTSSSTPTMGRAAAVEGRRHEPVRGGWDGGGLGGHLAQSSEILGQGLGAIAVSGEDRGVGDVQHLGRPEHAEGLFDARAAVTLLEPDAPFGAVGIEGRRHGAPGELYGSTVRTSHTRPQRRRPWRFRPRKRAPGTAAVAPPSQSADTHSWLQSPTRVTSRTTSHTASMGASTTTSLRPAFWTCRPSLGAPQHALFWRR